MDTRTLLFDLDGTLTDPAEGFIRSIRYALEPTGVAQLSDATLVSYIGPPLRNTMMALLGTDNTEQVEQAVERYRQRYRESGMFENRVYDGVPEALQTLHNVGVQMFVATSKMTFFAKSILQHFDLDHYFVGIYGSLPGALLDNKRLLLEHIIRTEGITPATTTMIGDRDVDMIAARANNCRAVGVAWGYGSLRELQEAGAERILDAPAKLSTL